MNLWTVLAFGVGMVYGIALMWWADRDREEEIRYWFERAQSRIGSSKGGEEDER